MRPIRVLPPEVVREIAAGEVITRPADVVKELLENALDAGASRIEIELQRGGLDSVRVSDDGAGIPETDVELAPRRFATSKLEPLAGLGGVSSLGFRGEALWSVAYAARLELVTRPAGQLGGVRLTARGDEVEVASVACAAGTTVEARDLFADLPARRASLESPALEARRVLAVVSRYALHHPGVAWRLVHDGAVRLAHAPGGFREATATVYGALAGNRTLSVQHEAGGYRLTGTVSRPELARPRRDRMHLAVNGRPVELEEGLAATVVRAYEAMLPRGHAPLAVLNLTAPPERLNVNTHPGKLRVAYHEPDVVERLLLEGVGAALAEHPLARPAPEPRVVAGPVPAHNGSFPPLAHLGTYRETYLLAEGDGDLWLVDQHAAHERVIFEELERAFDAGEALELPEPELVTLTPAQAAAWDARAAELEAWGLRLEDFGGGLWRVRSLPAVALGLPVGNVVGEVIAHALGPDEARRAVLARLACHPAVRAGHVLSFEGAERLLEALGACRVPWACPHGRPTALRLAERDLAHRFGRRGPRDLPRVGDERPAPR